MKSCSRGPVPFSSLIFTHLQSKLKRNYRQQNDYHNQRIQRYLYLRLAAILVASSILLQLSISVTGAIDSDSYFRYRTHDRAPISRHTQSPPPPFHQFPLPYQPASSAAASLAIRHGCALYVDPCTAGSGLLGGGLRTHPALNLGGHRHKRLLYVGGRLGGRLQERDAQLIRVRLPGNVMRRVSECKIRNTVKQNTNICEWFATSS